LYGASELQMGGAIANSDDMIRYWWYDMMLRIFLSWYNVFTYWSFNLTLGWLSVRLKVTLGLRLGKGLGLGVGLRAGLIIEFASVRDGLIIADVDGEVPNLLRTCCYSNTANTSATSRCNGIWETTRHTQRTSARANLWTFVVDFLRRLFVPTSNTEKSSNTSDTIKL